MSLLCMDEYKWALDYCKLCKGRGVVGAVVVVAGLEDGHWMKTQLENLVKQMGSTVESHFRGHSTLFSVVSSSK